MKTDLGQKYSDGHATVQRLLDVAEELFAEHGFEHASVREITDRAQCNIAAVNYHFRSKENLYLEVMRRRFKSLRDYRLRALRPLLDPAEPPPALHRVVHTFVNAFLEPLLGDGEGRKFLELIAHEFSAPRLPPHIFFEEMMQPVIEAFSQALRLACPSISTAHLQFSIESLVAQLIHVVQVRKLNISMVGPPFRSAELADVINHITRFSVAGILRGTDEVAL